MHLALVAIPIRTLFIPVGFQSIRCDPNILFEAIENVRTEKEEEATIESLEKKDFFYFSESSKDKKLLDEYNPDDKLINPNLMTELNPNLDEEGAKKEETSARQQVMSTLREGDERMVTEIFGVSEIGGNNGNDDDKISILPVTFDLNMRSIITRG
jgi:hypothetical protein